MSRPRSERPSAGKVVSHLSVMVVVSAVLGVVASGLAIPFAGLLGFAADKSAKTMDDLPQELETEDLPQKTRILDRKGRVIATIYDENRLNVRLKDVSEIMRKAIVSIEDSRFYKHGALDIRGTFRAFVTNQAAGGTAQGGSTITQQLVKLTLVNAADTAEEVAAATDNSYSRKVRELRYAIALEKEHSKDWILERYLNTAYFGDGAYGIQAAAKHFFSVNARKLNLNQAATLAGLVKNPTKFDPTNSNNLAIQRRDVVLDRMAQLGAITQEQADRTKNRSLGLKPKKANNGCVNSQVPLFCSYALNYLYTDPSLGRTADQRRHLVRNGGLTIQTTVDLRYQRAATNAAQNRVKQTDPAIGSLAMVEPGTGEVRAIAQSRPVGRRKNKGETFLNFAVPKQYGNSNGFQAGSTFKVFVLAEAIRKGVPLSRTYNSPNETTFNFSDYENCPGAPTFGTADFPMRNSTEGGLENLYTGTRDSVNTFYLRLEQDTGVCDPYNLAKSMGVRLTNPTGDKQGRGAERIPLFTLGVADVSPLEMAEAYATFAARGIHCDSRPIQQIRDAEGRVLKDYQPQCQRVMEKNTADAVNDILKGVIEPGGFADAEALSVPAAGKTGTTGTVAQSPSVWFVGYTPDLATAAMVAGANKEGTPLGLDGLVINDVQVTASGSGLAAPIWGDAMRAVDDTLSGEDFHFPEGIVGVGSESVPIPEPDPPPGRGNGGGRGGGGGNGGGGGRGGGRG